MTKFLTAGELAVHLRVKRSTILAWRRRGLIPFVRATRRPILFDLDAVVNELKRSSYGGHLSSSTEVRDEA